MITYITNDGEKVTGRTSRDIVKALRALSHTPEATLKAFMAETASRVLTQTGTIVPTSTESPFVAGLVEAGLLKKEPPA